MKKQHSKSDQKRLEKLICQAYESTPHANPARLAQIEHGLASTLYKKTTHQPGKRNPHAGWWFGLLALATGAAAWWAIGHHDAAAPISQHDMEKKLSTPAIDETSSPGHSFNSPPQESIDSQAQDVTNNPRETLDTPSSAQAQDERSAVIYKREVY